MLCMCIYTYIYIYYIYIYVNVKEYCLKKVLTEEGNSRNILKICFFFD